MIGKGVSRVLLDKLLDFHDWHNIGRVGVNYTKIFKKFKNKKVKFFKKVKIFKKYQKKIKKSFKKI